MSQPNIHVCTGTGKRYVGMVRIIGHKKWKPTGPRRKSCKKAADDMYREFMKSKNYKRGVVLMEADYYEPVGIIFINR